jgi:hypothetical protein
MEIQNLAGRFVGLLLLAQAAAGLALCYLLLEPTFGPGVAMLLLLPAGLSHLALAGWLLVNDLGGDPLPSEAARSR